MLRAWGDSPHTEHSTTPKPGVDVPGVQETPPFIADVQIRKLPGCALVSLCDWVES